MKEILKDKVAVITGGTRGLGRAIAQTYARAGANVVIASRSHQSVKLAVDSLRAEGYPATGLACDVADFAQVEVLAEHAIQTFGHMDIWVNNAGLSAPYGPTVHIPAEHFMKVVGTNIVGTYNGSVIAMRHFLKRKRGKLINVLGRGDTGAIPMQNAYSSSKAWIRNFTKVLAREYKDSGIEVMGFNPGLVRTEFLSSVQVVRGYETKLNPLRYVVMLWGNEVEVPAQKALWLASSATDGKTGLLAKVLTSGFMISRLITVPLSRLLRNHNELMELNITSIEPAIRGDRF